MDNQLIHSMLMEQNKTSFEQNKLLGEIKANIESLNEKLDTQLYSCAAVEKRVAALESHHQRQAGKTTVWSLIGGAAVVVIGWIIQIIARH
jgi:hypothetical protein